MGTERVVRLIITGDNAGALKAIEGTEAAAKGFGEKSMALGTKVSKVGTALTAFSLPLLAIGGYATKSAVDFQSSMKLIQTQAGASATEVAAQSRGILKMAGQVGAPPEELAKGLYHLESVGIRGAHAHEALKAAAIGAAVGHDTLEATTNAMAAALKTKLRDVHNTSEAMGIMDKVAEHGNMRLEQMTEAMGTGIASAAQKAGVGMKGFGAAIDVMTSRGVPANVAATRLRSDLIRMVAPSKEAAKALAGIGIGPHTLAESMEKSGNLAAPFRMLQERMKGLAKPIQNQILSEIFGKSKGASTAMELLSGTSEMERLLPQLKGNLLEKWKETKETAASKLARQLAKLRASLIKLGTALMPVVIPAIIKLAGVLSSVVSGFAKLPAPVKTVLIGLAGLLAVLGPILTIVGRLITAVGALAKVFTFVSGVMEGGLALDPVLLGIVALGVAVMLVATHFNTFKQIVGDVFHWLSGAVSTVISFVEAHWPLLLGILLGPFGLMVGFVVTHFDQVKKITMDVFGAIGGFVSKVFDSIANAVIKSINLIISAIDVMIKGYDDVTGFIGIGPHIGTLGHIKELGATHHLAHRAAHALAPAAHHHALAAGGYDAQPIHIHNKLYVDRRSARPFAESVTEYTLKRNARK